MADQAGGPSMLVLHPGETDRKTTQDHPFTLNIKGATLYRALCNNNPLKKRFRIELEGSLRSSVRCSLEP